MGKRIGLAVLVVASAVLGATVLREPLAQAAKPVAGVFVTNDSSQPVPVQQQGTATVAGTVGLDPSANTVTLDSADGALLASLDNRLSQVENAVSKLTFDGGGNLQTTAPAPAPASEHCAVAGGSVVDVRNDGLVHTLCTDDVFLTNITAAGMDDDKVIVSFYLDGQLQLSLTGAGYSFGSGAFQLDLTHPIHANEVLADCSNSSGDCSFTLALVGVAASS